MRALLPVLSGEGPPLNAVTARASMDEPPPSRGAVVPERALRWQVLWTMLGSGIFLLAQYGMLMSVAKLGTPDMVGQFSLALAIATPIMVLSQMQLRQILVTDVHRLVPFGDYFWTRLATGVCGILVIVLAGMALGHSLPLRLLTVAFAIAKLAESLSDILNGSLQRREHMGLVALSVAVRGIVGLVVLVVVLKITASLYAATMGMALSWLACALLVDIPMVLRSGERLGMSWHPSVLIRMLMASAPLTLAAGLLSFSAGVPRYFLGFTSGKESVAILAVAMMPISLMGLFTGAVSQATLARASAYLHTGRLGAFGVLGRRLILFNFLVGGCLVALLLLAGHPLVRFLYTPEYDASVPVMLVLGGGVAVASIGAFGSAVITAGRRFGLTLANVVIALAVQLPLCWILIPRLGVMGAAWAECAKYLVTSAFLYFAGRRVYGTMSSATSATC